MTIRQRRLLQRAMPWLFTAVLLGAWELACIAFEIQEIVLPRPSRIFETMPAQLSRV